MSYIMMDIEADGPIPGDYSMISLGAVLVEPTLSKTNNFKHLRKTPHTHHPVDDAKGNAEAFLELIKEYKLGIKL